MTIYDNKAFCNRLHNVKLSNFGQGNVIPNIWYHKVLHDSGKPDCVGLTILSELFSLHKNSKAQVRKFRITYAELSAKFNYSIRQLLEAFLRLKKNNLISRSRRTIEIDIYNFRSLFEDDTTYDKSCELKNAISEYSNIVPNAWYHKVLSDNGKPDFIGITILSELLRLHQNSKIQAREFQITYAALSTKFNYSDRQLYEALVRLEKNRLIKRSNSPIQIGAHNVGNFLYITLNVEQLIALENTNVSAEKKFSFSRHKSPSLNEQRPHHNADVTGNIKQSDLQLYDLTKNYNFRKEPSYE